MNLQKDQLQRFRNLENKETNWTNAQEVFLIHRPVLALLNLGGHSRHDTDAYTSQMKCMLLRTEYKLNKTVSKLLILPGNVRKYKKLTIAWLGVTKGSFFSILIYAHSQSKWITSS